MNTNDFKKLIGWGSYPLTKVALMLFIDRVGNFTEHPLAQEIYDGLEATEQQDVMRYFMESMDDE